jgi:hypothetical protein
MCVLIFSTSLKKKWERYDQKCVSVFMHSTRYSCMIIMKHEFSRQIYLKYSNFMKIRPVEADLFHADRYDEANSRFSQFSESA